jgi:alpha-pyrone synthase
MGAAYLNRVGIAVPPHEVHKKFIEYAPRLLASERDRRLFQRMADKSGIERRWSFLEPSPDPEKLDDIGFFRRGSFPGTARRMRFFEDHAFRLAREAVDDLGRPEGVTHLLSTCCTGFYAPGLDLQLARHLGLGGGVERTLVGFMGCQAAINALKLARHIVRSEPAARVLIVSLELCTLHLQETSELDQVLSYLLFSDGCAASLVSAEARGIALERFATAVIPGTDGQITWRVGDQGFDMRLSGQVPATLARDLPVAMRALVDEHEPALWAVHPGGRSILDAVERGIGLDGAALEPSRGVLRDFGNMSSPTVMFVLRSILDNAPCDRAGCAIAFGPGLTAETLLFRTAG